jgi:hypothetical protein
MFKGNLAGDMHAWTFVVRIGNEGVIGKMMLDAGRGCWVTGGMLRTKSWWGKVVS